MPSSIFYKPPLLPKHQSYFIEGPDNRGWQTRAGAPVRKLTKHLATRSRIGDTRDTANPRRNGGEEEKG
jgi:hypothetical protein